MADRHHHIIESVGQGRTPIILQGNGQVVNTGGNLAMVLLQDFPERRGIELDLDAGIGTRAELYGNCLTCGGVGIQDRFGGCARSLREGRCQ